MNNPFTFGRVVDGKEYCPRPDAEKMLKQSVKGGQNIAIIGQRRVGKTSLILNAVGSMRGYHLLYVDLMAVNSVAEISERIGRAYIKMSHAKGFIEAAVQLFAKLRPTMSFDPLTGTPSVGLSVDRSFAIQTLEDVLDRLEEAHKRHKLVVVLDEFQDVLRVDEPEKTLALMRSKIQLQGDLPYVFSGSMRTKMRTIFNDPESAFYKSAISLELETLSSEVFERFIVKHFKCGGREFDVALFETFRSMGVEVTGDVQQLCWALWEVSESGDVLSGQALQGALDMIFALERTSYENTVSELTDLQRRCLVGLVKTGGQSIHSKMFKQVSGVTQSSSITRAINRLIERRVVYRHRKSYQAANPFFAVWLQRKEYISSN